MYTPQQERGQSPCVGQEVLFLEAFSYWYNERMKVPAQIPEKGFYYHYKHDSKGSINNYAYEVLNIGHHTEEENTFFVLYRPLYEDAHVYKEGGYYDVRPLGMFMEQVVKNGVSIPRFQKITDSAVIAKLEEIKIKMYA